MKIADYFYNVDLKNLFLDVFLKTKHVRILKKLQHIEQLGLYFDTDAFLIRNMFLMLFLRESVVNSAQFNKLFGFLKFKTSSDTNLLTHDKIVISSLLWFFDPEKELKNNFDIDLEEENLELICSNMWNPAALSKNHFNIFLEENTHFIG